MATTPSLVKKTTHLVPDRAQEVSDKRLEVTAARTARTLTTDATKHT